MIRDLYPLTTMKQPIVLPEYLEQLYRSTQLFQRQLAPLTEMHEQMREALRPTIEFNEQITKALQPVAEMQRRVAELTSITRLPDSLYAGLTAAAEGAFEFRRQLEAFATPAFTNLAEHFRKLPERTRNALLVLGNHGWYLDLEMPLPALWELERDLTDGNVDEAETSLQEYFRERADGIATALKVAFPRRERVLGAAFAAHARGEFELSIPVFLAQADGICLELIGVQLFTKRDKKPAPAAYVESIALDTFRSAMMHPLANPLPISFSAQERGADFDDLNRHQVLHGESVDYGIEVNSLKAISLLNYVFQVLSKDDQSEKVEA